MNNHCNRRQWLAAAAAAAGGLGRRVLGISVTESILRKVYYENAARLLGMSL